MKKKYLYVFVLQFLITSFISTSVYAQENIGMASGNYAGITGVWFNPASIADSRYKFDVNIIGVNSYFNNNYLLVKNSAIVRRLFYKEPYNGSFTSVKNDLLQEQLPFKANVYGRVENTIHFPFSFMVTTGKQSAIAITMTNRTVNKIDKLNPDLAHAFFAELRDSAIYGRAMVTDSMQYNFLNWQEVGFTYSRVIINADHHFLKMGATLKWLGANAGGYIQTDKATVSFKDSQTLSLNSPLVHYARTANADFGQFRRRDIFNNLEDQSFGWDAGLVYEFRAKVKKFKYVNESLEEKQRRDLNKYMFRIGVSLVDMGKFTLTKKQLTNNFNANIINWDFSNVRASSLSDFDTALAKKVNYISGAPTTFTYRLPAAMIANFDLHLFGGFYVNVAAKAPFESFKKSTDTYISANKWIAITPRFEGKFFSVYVPIIRANERTNIGATVKFGPLYLGSNNLSQILTNPSSYEADFHAGLRFSVPYGKPSAIGKYAQRVLEGNSKAASQTQLDSLKREVEWLKRNQHDTSKNIPVQVFITNYGVSSQVQNRNGDSILISNKPQAELKTNQAELNSQYELKIDTLIRQLAEKNLQAEKMKVSVEQEPVQKGKKNKEKKLQKGVSKVETTNPELVAEMERIRKQLQIQNAAIIGGGTVAAIAATDKKEKPAGGVADSTVRKDTLPADSNLQTATKRIDTVYIKDTITNKAGLSENNAYNLVKEYQFAPILFANGSAVISPADRIRLQQLAAQTKQNSHWRIEITAMTDSKGSVQANKKVAVKRIDNVTAILFANGINENRLFFRYLLAATNTVPAEENPRRVEIRVLQTY